MMNEGKGLSVKKIYDDYLPELLLGKQLQDIKTGKLKYLHL